MSTLRFVILLIVVLFAVRYYNGNERAKRVAAEQAIHEVERKESKRRIDSIRTQEDQLRELKRATDSLIEAKERQKVLDAAAEEERNRPAWKQAIYSLLNL